MLLFWAIIYICDYYKSLHADSHSEYVQKSKLESKLESTWDKANGSLNDRRDTINREQEDAVKELHNRARIYREDKQKHLKEILESKSKKQRVLTVALSVLICLAAPVAGVFVLAIINQYTAMKIDLEFAAGVIFIASILFVNRNRPSWVMFYEWLKLVLLCIIGIIVCSYLEVIIEHFLGVAGIKGVDARIPLILLVVAGICRWMSRHIEVLVRAKPVFAVMQFVAIGVLLGQVCLLIVDRTGRIPTIIGVAIILAVILLSRIKILVRKNVRLCAIAVAVGILYVNFVVLLI